MTQRLPGRLINFLGLGMAGCVIVTLAAPNAVPAHFRMLIDRPASADTISINYANCLWSVARNEGFYSTQRAVAKGNDTAAENLLWADFARSSGAAQCGTRSASISDVDLYKALYLTVNQADQHFLGRAEIES